MQIKPITSATVARLNKATDKKLTSLIEWLNHTSHAEAFELAGRLYYRVHVKIGRNITSIQEFSTMRNENGVVIEWVSLTKEQE